MKQVLGVLFQQFLIKCLLFTITERQNTQDWQTLRAVKEQNRHYQGVTQPLLRPPAVSPIPALPEGCPGTVSHSPAQELSKLTNRAEACLCFSADFSTGQWHQPGQRGSQEKNEKRQEVSTTLLGQGGGSQLTPFGRNKLSPFIPLCQLQMVCSYYKSRVVTALASKHT